jgi:hypothetical protein
MLIGNGHNKEDIVRKIIKTNNIIWLPFIPIWRMPLIYSSVDIVGHIEIRFPVPGHSSLVPIESQITGTPILTNLPVRLIFSNDLIINITLDERDQIDVNDFVKALSQISKLNHRYHYPNSFIKDIAISWASRVNDVEVFLFKCIDSRPS